MVSLPHERDALMKSRFLRASFFTVLLFFQAPLFAQDSAATPKIEWAGMAALEEGQFVKCQYYLDNGAPMPFRPWLTNEYARLGIQAIINRHFSMAVIPQVKIWNDTWNWIHMNGASAANNPLDQHVTVSLADAEGTFSFGNKDAIVWNISAGIIPYKYDAEAKNLGEYLFRAGEHPAYIETAFDQAYATLTGFRVNAEILRNLSLDLFFTTETQVQPMNDWSLSFLLGYKLPGYLDAGAGIMFDRLIPVSGLLDNPPDPNNIYKSSTGQIDTFSFGGTKVMTRVSFDPKGFLPSNISRIFGKEDGKIYGEAAILGLKNIIAYKDSMNPNTGLAVPGHEVIDSSRNFYSDIKQRIPIMFGFNWPTNPLLSYSLVPIAAILGYDRNDFDKHSIALGSSAIAGGIVAGLGTWFLEQYFKTNLHLDVLSVEAEWSGWPYSTNLYNIENFYWVLPKPNGVGTGSPWKYSINFRKAVWEHVSLIGQIARDHTRHDVFYNGNTDVTEIFQTKDEWGWWMKLQYNF
jgi:hypothetical protein